LKRWSFKRAIAAFDRDARRLAAARTAAKNEAPLAFLGNLLYKVPRAIGTTNYKS
jgi:hypothetical protein